MRKWLATVEFFLANACCNRTNFSVGPNAKKNAQGQRQSKIERNCI